jgi:hypothetical protein
MTVGKTGIAEVTEQIQKFWGPLSASQLLQTNPLLSVVNRDYEGVLQRKGDTAYVSVMRPFTGKTQTVGVDADTFEADKVSLVRTPIVANKVFYHAVEMESLAELQSQLDSNDAGLRSLMMQAVSDQINKYLYSFVKTSIVDGSTGDSGVATMTKDPIAGARKFGGVQKWPKNGNWYGLLDPSYYTDLSIDSVLANTDYIPNPVIEGGNEFRKVLDFRIAEDNSLPTAQGLFFHREFLYFVMQLMPVFKVSDLHSNYKRGVLVSVDVVGGAAKNAYAGDLMHYPVYNSAWTAVS